MEVFNDVQKNDGSLKRSAQLLLDCAKSDPEPTLESLYQALLQLFACKIRSRKVAMIYKLLRRFLECARTRSVAEKWEISAENIGRSLALLCCKVCGSSRYLVQVRASSTLSTTG